MKNIQLSGRAPTKPASREEEIDQRVEALSAIKDPALRCRALQGYVRDLLASRPRGRGRLADPFTARAQHIADWETYEQVEKIRKEEKISIAYACASLADDRGLKGDSSDSGLRKAYYRHLWFHARSVTQDTE